ncbi:thiamine phosphate synthase [Agromyces sp. SYSU K20354]|uniref:thiamine phosphate synthase n=1 Tax=Agromyces cavernae TaxID=2898659 RepID=UPI001E5FB74A|nr:thiamine phosphate synthase [Agromyces cavernae]MCD2443444.1 thiamine phosphate synthase [Agromyces cavernae]
MPRLLILTDRVQLPPGRSLFATLQACTEAGATTVVIRELDLPYPRRAALARRLADLPGLTVIASRAPFPGAVAVHLPSAAAGTSTGIDRLPLGAESWFGRSCHTPDEVGRAASEGAAYATLSPFAATASKPGYGPPLDPTAFAGHDVPVYALGGIHAGNAASARRAGAYGVAVMGALMRAEHPGRLVGSLLEAVR